MFLAALIFAPWAYGSTPPSIIHWLEILLFAILFLWAIGCAARRMKPSIHPLVLWCGAVILLQGWGMTLNPHFRNIGHFRFEPIAARFPSLPGSVDAGTSTEQMLRVSALLGILCFVCDLAARRVWRRRIWWTIASTGIALVLFGLVQSASSRPLIFSVTEDANVPFFATYYYHGNAGAYINLVLPLVAGLAALTLRNAAARLRPIWAPGFFICAAGAFVNVSRTGMVITALLCASLLAWQFDRSSRGTLLPPRKLRAAYGAIMIVALVCLVAFAGWERPAKKWALLESQLNSDNKRLISTQVCLKMIPTASWHGFGPGTFMLAFPHYTNAFGDAIAGIWKYAHDDYLQTIIEWGWLGAMPWAILFFGAIFKLFSNWRKARRSSTSDPVLLFTSGLALAGVALHALVDFPLQIASLQLYVVTYMGFAWSCRLWSIDNLPANSEA